MPFLDLRQTVPIVDVRSPEEYRRGHIPGAVNIALFSDEERAAVGTTYVRTGPREAVLQGLEFVGIKMRGLCESALALKSEQLRVYCMRGGMRSRSIARLFETVNIQCMVLEGGYKTFRRAVADEIAMQRKLYILSGYTGSGKTEILNELKKKQQQVIDLEGLACNKGSVFGALGQPPQPSAEHFENLLFAELRKTDQTKPLWVEDESANIGKLQIPHSFFNLMKTAKTIQLQVPQSVRMARLLKEYGSFDCTLLAESIRKLEKRLGYERCRKAIELCLAGELRQAAKILLDYYDKAYELQFSMRVPETVIQLEFPASTSVAEIAERVMSYEL